MDTGVGVVADKYVTPAVGSYAMWTHLSVGSPDGSSYRPESFVEGFVETGNSSINTNRYELGVVVTDKTYIICRVVGIANAGMNVHESRWCWHCLTIHQSFAKTESSISWKKAHESQKNLHLCWSHRKLLTT